MATTQITVRLPSEEVAFLDQLVADGKATSRAAALSKALKRERRRLRAEQDLQILLAASPDHPDSPDGDAWARTNAAEGWEHLDDTDWSHLA